MKKTVVYSLKIVILFLTFHFIINAIQTEAIIDVLVNIELIPLFMAFIAMAMVLYFLGRRLSAVTLLQIRLKILFMMKVYFFNNLLPAQIGGDIYKFKSLYSDSLKTAGLSAAIISDRILGMLSLILLSIINIAIGYSYFTNMNILYSTLSFLGLLVFITIIFWLLPKQCNSRFQQLKFLYNKVICLREEVQSYVKTNLTIGLIYSFLSYFFLILVNIFAMYGVTERLELISSFLFIPVISIAVITMPISFNGLGIRESLFIIFFQMTGFSAEEALAMAAINFFVIISYSIGGGIAVLLEKENKIIKKENVNPFQ